jgi:hypothetical protein
MAPRTYQDVTQRVQSDDTLWPADTPHVVKVIL